MSTVLGIPQETPPPRWNEEWVQKIIDTHRRSRRLRTQLSLPTIFPDPYCPEWKPRL